MVALQEDNGRVRFAFRPAGGIDLGSAAVRLVDHFLAWQERQRERAYLANGDARLLRDCAIGRADAAIEAAKPFWRG